MNRKGGLFDIFILLIVGFVVFLFFAAWVYGFNLLTNQIVDSGIIVDNPFNDGTTNISDIGEDTFGAVNTGLGSLKWIALVIFIAMIMGIMVSNFLVKAHPAFFIVYVLITIIAVVFSVYISNAYETIVTSANPLGPTLQSFGAMDFIMNNLPIWTTIIGFMGAIFLFMGIIADNEQGGSIPI